MSSDIPKLVDENSEEIHPAKSPDNPQDWVDEALQKIEISSSMDADDTGEYCIVGIEHAKAAIQQRFIAQAKQHQVELLKARIDTAKRIYRNVCESDLGYVAQDKYLLLHIDELNEELQAELAKLEATNANT
jgi:hypothetical protein